MYLNVPVLFTALSAFATTASADWMNVGMVSFHTANGDYSIDADNGCRGTSVPDMIEFCADYARDRAHFKFKGWTTKSCLHVTSSDINTCGTGFTCGTMIFEPVKCTW
ncbi:uncharacterized protein B0H64DRAFT_376033 [Chaetomium fimeti]|uniref:Uncharacterized protein n=1 Tax=Chaetomium fimeti TaxID=1854472 RepID=A0AAE0HAP1_9PEZI|nr:hypothetical protein B0H64DRAFT_376033 [Chaetomium fimeti]